MVAEKNYFQNIGKPFPPEVTTSDKPSSPPGSTSVLPEAGMNGGIPVVSNRDKMRADGKQILMDKAGISDNICLNIRIGICQIDKGKTILSEIKGNITDDVWNSESGKEYLRYLESYEKYIGDVSKFFDNFSKKLIKNAEVFEELDALLNKQLSFDDWRP
ncbi:hypothetical protein [Carnobacterium maltaromaticum]|uniref:hypothetical protein n=1 Tax=Carnobacterium maltaromaticum TaxID=2751 RepID=UPI0039B030A9